MRKIKEVQGGNECMKECDGRAGKRIENGIKRWKVMQDQNNQNEKDKYRDKDRDEKV